MGVGSWGREGGRAPLDFHAWYTDIVDRGLIVLFFGFFSIFRSFRTPPWNFSSYALGCWLSMMSVGIS